MQPFPLTPIPNMCKRGGKVTHNILQPSLISSNVRLREYNGLHLGCHTYGRGAKTGPWGQKHINWQIFNQMHF